MIILLASGQADSLKLATDSESEQATAFSKATVARYVMHLGDAPIAAQSEPVFRWTNQLGRRFFGDVYVWTHLGRPEVVASVTSVFGSQRKFETELHSLSTGRPTLEDEGRIIWKPSRPGIVLKRLPNVALPGESPVSRLRQMRTIASRFLVSAEYNATAERLRLIRSPIFRYESTDPKVLDGALFAFVKGTDPDALLIIESRADRSGQFEWQFAMARFNGNCALKAKFDDLDVWKVERASSRSLTDPYFAIRGAWPRAADE